MDDFFIRVEKRGMCREGSLPLDGALCDFSNLSASQNQTDKEL